MSDDLILLALFVFLYVSDSYFLLHKHSVLFREAARGRCRIILPSSNAGSNNYALHVFSLLPPLRSLYVCNLLPISISEKGILSFVSQTLTESGRPRQSYGEIEYGNINSVKTDKNNLLINNERFVSCQAKEHAVLIAGAVEDIIATNGQMAPQILEEVISSIFDVNYINLAVAEYRKASGPLLYLCNTIFFVFFILFPILARWQGLVVSLIITLVLLGILLPPLCVTFCSLHKKFTVGSKWDRIGCVVRFIICPPCAIRANDQISRFLVAKYHPAAVALALCGKLDALDLIRKILRDLRNPLRPDVNVNLTLSIDEEWRKKMIAAVERTALQSGIENKELIEVPEKSDPSIHTFCPRCLTQFFAPIDSCPDCLGVTTILFPSPEETHE